MNDQHATGSRAATDWVDVPVSIETFDYLIDHAKEKDVDVDEVLRLLIERYEDG